MKQVHVRRMSGLLFSLIFGVFFASGARAEPRGPWLGQQVPGETPLPFAQETFKGVDPWVETCEFSPDGTMCIISVGNESYSKSRLLLSRLQGDTWSSFVPAPFAEGFVYANEAVFSADGRTLTFTGQRGKSDSKDFWVLPCMDGEFGEPKPLPEPVSSDSGEFRICYLADGSFYFASNRTGTSQVYRAIPDGKGAYAVSMLDPPINTGAFEGDPCLPRDGRYLVYYNSSRTNTNLAVAFPGEGTSWGKPIPLGAAFNSGVDEYGAHLSADGKILFFTRHTRAGNIIFWVSSSVVDKLRP